MELEVKVDDELELGVVELELFIEDRELEFGVVEIELEVSAVDEDFALVVVEEVCDVKDEDRLSVVEKELELSVVVVAEDTVPVEDDALLLGVMFVKVVLSVLEEDELELKGVVAELELSAEEDALELRLVALEELIVVESELE